ncbi:hypothetical protein MRB53_024735 [Persea americana]|uniref:Uncharacterized protein n=1 Tax=Persea americana TaxID=3435 RepID=A0ACC2LE72_PERAE|nr:hypothetical protein MRB53_024735 [Persea americana]
MRRSRFSSGESESSAASDEKIEWEMRPGGMLVQKRASKSDIPVPDLRLRVAYGTFRYEISIKSQATFGELKKLLTAETGLQPGEQRLLFRDPSSREKRFIEMRRNAKIQSAHRAISDVSMEVDNLADQVSAIEKSISNGSRVPEVQVTTLIEMLMRQAIKLDSISTEGDASAQKILQAKRVQKCVETLDLLKISNARIKPAVVTTKWETFDPPASTQWEFFD